MIENHAIIEQVKLLVIGTEVEDTGTYKDVHHWLELDVPLFGATATFDVEEKARIIYEEIPLPLLRFTVEYLWQSDFHWQSEGLKKILTEYGNPSKN